MASEKMGDHGLDEPPKFGLKLRLDHEFPLQSKQIIKPSAHQVFDLMPLTARYVKYYLGKKFNNKKPIMDYFNMISAQRMYGVSIIMKQAVNAECFEFFKSKYIPIEKS